MAQLCRQNLNLREDCLEKSCEFSCCPLFFPQFIVFPSPTFWGKIRDWFTFLNRLELVNLLLAFIGFALRSDSDYYTSAKTVYCINAVIFYIRIIKVYIANSHLGPMIFRMVRLFGSPDVQNGMVVWIP